VHYPHIARPGAFVSIDALLPKLEADQDLTAVELASLSDLDSASRERFLDVWRRLSIQRRRTIIDTLAEIAEDNVEFNFDSIFMIGLLDDDVQVRADSVKALWEYEGDDLVALLLRLLHDPEALVRAEAALALGRFLLRAELSDDEDPRTAEIEEELRNVVYDSAELAEVRGRAIEAVGVRGHEWVRDIIEEAYTSGERRLQISAVHAMGRNADTDWLPTIIEQMHSDDGEMRFEAAVAAGGIAEEEAIPELAELASDEDPEVQEAAIGALGQIGGPSARSVLQSIASESDDTRVLEAVTDALAEADFIEDPMALKLYLDQSVADDRDEDEDE
jgi:HEAT repeat protein